MRRVKYLFCVLAAALLLAVPALAAEEEEGFVFIEDQGYVELFQEGSLSGEQTIPQKASLLSLTNDDEQQFYESIYRDLCNQQSTIIVSTTIQIPDWDQAQTELKNFQSEILELYKAVVNDNPRLFYVTGGYSAKSNGSGSPSAFLMTVTITPSYRGEFTETQVQQFNQIADELVARANALQTDLEKALFIHDYLATHVAYNRAVSTGQGTYSQNVYTAYGALVEGDAVCQGYALAYKLLLKDLGIECITVTSEAMNHMWNLVQMDGNWYHVDVTWDDPTPNLEGRCGHSYFMLSDDTIRDEEHNHFGWDETAPVCTSMRYEQSWAFNDTELPIYWWDDRIYYATQTSGCYNVYETNALDREGTLEVKTTKSFVNQYRYIVNSAVWADGALCYVDSDKELKMLSLTDHDIRTLGTISDFVEEDSTETDTNGTPCYPAQYDGIGLRYDEATKTVSAISANRATELGRFVILDYPSDWDQVSKDTTALAGARWKDDTSLQIGMVYVDSEAKPTLWAATYENGRMTEVYEVDTSNLTDGLNILELTVASGQAGETRLFLLTESGYVPVGATVTVP